MTMFPDRVEQADNGIFVYCERTHTIKRLMTDVHLPVIDDAFEEIYRRYGFTPIMQLIQQQTKDRYSFEWVHGTIQIRDVSGKDNMRLLVTEFARCFQYFLNQKPVTTSCFDRPLRTKRQPHQTRSLPHETGKTSSGHVSGRYMF